jgi:uncharacterized protein
MLQPSDYQPKRFFTITYLVTFISWSISAFISYQPGGESLFILFLIPGLVAPFGVALWMILRSPNPLLRKNFRDKVLNLRLIRPVSLLPILLIMPAVVILSAFISTFFGGSIEQIRLAREFSFSVGVAPVLLVLILAASFEELGWRSYAMDSLKINTNYFKATLVFAVLWAGWHLPLFFIKGYYQNEITRQSIWYGLNFFTSIIPLAFIITWICKLNRGSITAAILFHFFINICQEAFQITQNTKCIETGVLMLVAVLVVYFNRPLFFGIPKGEL